MIRNARFTFLVLFFTSLTSYSYFERQLGGLVISKPQGVILSAALAYNYELWKSQTKDNFWMYGYLRPKVGLDSSFLVNTVFSELQIFPISILGVSMGSAYAHRSVTDLAEFDCKLYECQKEFSKQYIKGQLAVGWGSIKAMYSYQEDRIYADQTDKPFLVETGVRLLMKSGFNLLAKQSMFVGYDLNSQWNIGGLYMFNRMNRTESEHHYALLQYKPLPWKVGLGVGTFESEYVKKSFSALVKVSWSVDPTLSLME